MEQIPFQIKAVDQLVGNIKRLWTLDERQVPIVLKAPTGSGKTYMTQKMICDMAEQPDWDRDVAYVWITFSDDLAMQSKHKFDIYFPTSKHGRLLTIEDFSLGALQKNDVLFINWQKLVSQKAADRIFRRPENPDERHESRVYFEDFVENTHSKGIEIIFIIDECHLNVTEAANRDVISKLDPKICIHVSATPPNEIVAKAAEHESFVQVKHEDVVAQGLIKESIVTQTKEDLARYKGEDEDHVLLKLAIEKRKELKAEIEAFGKKVNPLVIIQLPNDDETLIEQGQPTKEEITKEYLISQGVKANKIASWFTGKAKPEGLERNDSEYEYLLFKTAAGTGWDCPRAQILVMFRDIKSEIFSTQTIGRILRVPIMHEEVSKVFRNGYLYTNFSRKAVVEADYGSMGNNRPKTLISYNKRGEDFIIDPQLLTDTLSRVDYGDLGKSGDFQQCLFDTFNHYFGIAEDERFIDEIKAKLVSKGLNLNSDFVHEIIADAQFKDYEAIGINLKKSNGVVRECSKSDVQKLFTFTLVEILRSQTDNDCKVGNIVRSIPTLKSAIRLWFKYYALRNEDEDKWYRIFLNDTINKQSSSLFRRLITDTLKAYHPLLEEQLRQRREENERRQSLPFVLKKMYSYTEDHDELPEQKCLLHPFFLRHQYVGRKTEEDFSQYMDSQSNIKWWFKNGDSGKDWLAIRYFNQDRNEEALFYPDWVLQKTDGTICIFDTKGGQTASSSETKNKAEALQKRVALLNKESSLHYVAGIVVKANGIWYYNDNDDYSYRQGSTDGWKKVQDLLDEVRKDKTFKTCIIEGEIPASARFIHYLPLYSLQAACGYFECYEEPEAEGWVDVSSLPFKPNEDMFIVHAKGNSMLPKIKDGDLCVFERYRGGSREGEIVLSQVNEYLEEYGGKYTIKKYHSEKVINEDGVEEHSKIELQPLNTKDFKNIEISKADETQCATIGILKFVLGHSSE